MPYEELIDLLSSRNALIVHCSRPGKGDEGLDGRLFPDDLRDAIKVCNTGVGDVSCSVIWPGHSKTFGSVGIVLKPRSIASITSAHPTDAGTYTVNSETCPAIDGDRCRIVYLVISACYGGI